MPADSPFAPAWWFRTQFDRPGGAPVTLHFDGISYRANIFLNGQQIAESDRGRRHLPALRLRHHPVPRVRPERARRLGHRAAADRPGARLRRLEPRAGRQLMGIFRDVYLVKHGGGGDPRLRTSRRTSTAGGSAALTVGAELHNGDERAHHAGRSPAPSSGIAFQQDVTLAAGADDRGHVRPDDVSRSWSLPRRVSGGRRSSGRKTCTRSTSSSCDREASPRAADALRRARDHLVALEWVAASSRSTESRSSFEAQGIRRTSSTGRTPRGSRRRADLRGRPEPEHGPARGKARGRDTSSPGRPARASS